MTDFAEVTGTQPVQRRTVHLGGATDEVVDLGLERASFVVVPGVPRDVPAVGANLVRVPVLPLARQEITALQQQNALSGVSKNIGECSTAGAGTDDDDVVVFAHVRIASQAESWKWRYRSRSSEAG